MGKKILIKNGDVLVGEQFKKVNVLIEEGKITKIGSFIEEDEEDVVDVEGRRIIPGFIDIHTHGAIGVDMNDCDVERLGKVCEFLASCGTTTFVPALLTDSKEKLMECIGNIVAGMKQINVGAKIYGIHMEGPYLSKDYKGAMPENLLQLPSIEEFELYQKVAKGAIKIITVSPEVEGIPEFIKEVSGSGVRISIGHSGADYETAMSCIENGATGATHIFNAMKLMHQHFPAISGAILESDIYCEAIGDGFHLAPATIRILIKAKGIDRVIGVTDSIMAAGLSDGKYKLGINDIVVINGDAKLADLVTRAGSTLTMDRAFRNLLSFTGRPIEDISKMLSKNPANYLGIGDYKGQILEGYDADLVILDDDFTIYQTFVMGKSKFTK